MKRVAFLGLVAIATMAIAACTQTSPADSAADSTADSATSSVAVSPAVEASPAGESPAPPTEAMASVPATTVSQRLAGQFETGEHTTSGGVQLVTTNGVTTLEFDQTFVTSEAGPDLVVILHRLPDVLGSTEPPAYAIQEGDYVVLAPLQAFRGAQRYTVPTDIDLSNYASVAIWCRRFNATFGAAVLQ